MTCAGCRPDLPHKLCLVFADSAPGQNGPHKTVVFVAPQLSMLGKPASSGIPTSNNCGCHCRAGVPSVASRAEDDCAGALSHDHLACRLALSIPKPRCLC